MSCARPLAHAFSSTFRMAAKTWAEYCPPAQPNCNQREKNSPQKSQRHARTGRRARQAAHQRCCWRAARMLEQQGQRRGEILTLFLLSMVSKAGVRWESAMWLNVRNDKRNPVPQAGSSREGFTASPRGHRHSHRHSARRVRSHPGPLPPSEFGHRCV